MKLSELVEYALANFWPDAEVGGFWQDYAGEEVKNWLKRHELDPDAEVGKPAEGTLKLIREDTHAMATAMQAFMQQIDQNWRL